MRDFSDRYLSILTNELKGINLTRIEDSEEFYHKQILDSVIPLNKSSNFKNHILETKLYIDIGFGGGFPILPLAYKLPEVKFLGFEARKKKVKAVTKIAECLNIGNAKLVHKRFETVLIDKDCVISFKAVGKIHDLMRQFKIKKGIQVYLYFYKGPKTNELEKIEPLKDWELIEDITFPVEFTEGRQIIAYKNKNVPCGTNKNLVNLTSLI